MKSEKMQNEVKKTPRIQYVMGVLMALAILPLPVACAGQDRSALDSSLRYGDELSLAIESFESSRLQTSQRINDVATKVTSAAFATPQPEAGDLMSIPQSASAQSAYTETVELEGLARTWEAEWKEIHLEVESLEESFSEVGERSERYFTRLEQITTEIHNHAMRATEEEKNRQLKEEWTVVFSQAAEDIGRLRTLIVLGDDFARVLRLAALRATLNEDLAQLQMVSLQAQELLHELEQLTIEGRRLTGGL